MVARSSLLIPIPINLPALGIPSVRLCRRVSIQARCMPEIPALGKWRQEDQEFQEFQATLREIVSSRPGWNIGESLCEVK